jgi:hypothetical protein
MTHKHSDSYLDEIQNQLEGDVFKTMLTVMARRVMGEELARHISAVGFNATKSKSTVRAPLL